MEVGKDIVLAAGAINSPQILMLSESAMRTTCANCPFRSSRIYPASVMA